MCVLSGKVRSGEVFSGAQVAAAVVVDGRGGGRDVIAVLVFPNCSHFG